MAVWMAEPDRTHDHVSVQPAEAGSRDFGSTIPVAVAVATVIGVILQLAVALSAPALPAEPLPVLAFEPGPAARTASIYWVTMVPHPSPPRRKL